MRKIQSFRWRRIKMCPFELRTVFFAGWAVWFLLAASAVSAAELVSVNSAETDSGNSTSRIPVISADGRFVAFQSNASDLGATDNNGVADVFVFVNELVNNSRPLDIKPQACPNPLNVNSQGVLPVAILGTEDFDVTQVDPASVRLAGVEPLRWDLEECGDSLRTFRR